MVFLAAPNTVTKTRDPRTSSSPNKSLLLGNKNQIKEVVHSNQEASNKMWSTLQMIVIWITGQAQQTRNGPRLPIRDWTRIMARKRELMKLINSLLRRGVSHRNRLVLSISNEAGLLVQWRVRFNSITISRLTLWQRYNKRSKIQIKCFSLLCLKIHTSLHKVWALKA